MEKTAPLIEIKGLTKSYGSKTAVDNITFTVYGWEVFGFLGPNGAGKTTTIKMIAGLLQPTSGNVKVNGFY
jgi:ABC-2 type transport system ATP-binding protein